MEAILQGEAAIVKQWNIKITVFQSGTFITNTPHMAEKVEIGSRKYPIHGYEICSHSWSFSRICGVPNNFTDNTSKPAST